MESSPDKVRVYMKAERRAARALQEDCAERMRLGIAPYDAAYWDRHYERGMIWPNILDARYRHLTREQADELSRQVGYEVPEIDKLESSQPFTGHSFGG